MSEFSEWGAGEEETPPEPPHLVRASDLVSEVPEPSELGFTPDGKYKGYEIALGLPPQAPEHEYLFDPETAPGRTVKAFYVRASDAAGSIGLVPWPGSTVIWPWEAGWVQDLKHDTSRDHIREAFVKAQQKKEKS